MYLLTEWEGGTRKYLAWGHGVQTECSEVRAPWPRAKYFRMRASVRPSYGDFLDSFAMKAREGPYRSYDKISYLSLGFLLLLRLFQQDLSNEIIFFLKTQNMLICVVLYIIFYVLSLLTY